MLALTAALTALLLTPVRADFSIFIGTKVDSTEGGNVPGQLMHLYNNPPSCSDDAINYYINPNNDATQSGWACDGCDIDEKVPDMKMKRIELPHDVEFSKDVGRLTLYLNEDNGGYGLFNEDMEHQGTCSRPKDPQYLDCTIVISNIEAWHAAECRTKFTLKDSN